MKVLKVVGAVSLTIGVLILGYICYDNYTTLRSMNKLLSGGVISDKELTSDDMSVSNLEDFTIEELTEDQEVMEITSGVEVVSIPSLDIKVPVVSGTDKDSLKLGAGKFDISCEMGELGNFAIAGHSSEVYNSIFNGLDDIKVLDTIECYNSDGTCFTYYVTDRFKTSPDNIQVTYPTSNATMTIVTCSDGGTQRFIVIATMMSDEELENYKRNLKQVYIDKAIDIADSYSSIDILTYLESGSYISKVPYNIDFCNFVETPSFFTNLSVFSDRLTNIEHNYKFIFGQSLGLNLSSYVKEE